MLFHSEKKKGRVNLGRKCDEFFISNLKSQLNEL